MLHDDHGAKKEEEEDDEEGNCSKKKTKTAAKHTAPEQMLSIVNQIKSKGLADSIPPKQKAAGRDQPWIDSSSSSSSSTGMDWLSFS